MRDLRILGNKVTDLSTQELLGELDTICRSNRSEVILNTNVHGILLSQKIPWLKEYRNQVRITHCDGVGVVLGARILGHEMGPRVSLNDCFWELAEFCVRRDYSVFLLGADADVIASAARTLKQRQPDIRIAGFHHGYFEKDGPESDAVVDLINRAAPNLLLVGFGMPIQERWVRDHAHRLNANVIWVVGGLFDLVSGALPLAPRWVRDHSLEWAWLSVRRPRRFFERYLFGNPSFIAQVILGRLSMKNGHARPE